MEISTRQFERLLTCSILLEEACEKNNVALRAARLIREQLDDIEAAAGPEEDYRIPEICDVIGDGKTLPEEVREYGQEIMAGGCGLKHLITLTMEHFGLTQTAFANMIGVNQGNLSHYLRFGLRREGVLKAVTEFFGFDGGAGNADSATCRTGRTGRTGRTNAGSKAEGK